MLICLLGFSDCLTKKFLWTYSVKNEEEFVLFCDLPKEPQKSHFYHRNQRSLTQGPEHLPCSGGSKGLSDVQWYLQPQNGDTLKEITKNYSHIILDQSTLRFLAMEMNNAGSYICRPRIRYVFLMYSCLRTFPSPVFSGIISMFIRPC